MFISYCNVKFHDTVGCPCGRPRSTPWVSPLGLSPRGLAAPVGVSPTPNRHYPAICFIFMHIICIMSNSSCIFIFIWIFFKLWNWSNKSKRMTVTFREYFPRYPYDYSLLGCNMRSETWCCQIAALLGLTAAQSVNILISVNNFHILTDVSFLSFIKET